MRYLIGCLIVVLTFDIIAFSQNTSIQYSPNIPPNPSRQVPWGGQIFAQPGMPNSWLGGKSLVKAKKPRRLGRFITSEPVIITIPDPDPKDKPRIE